MKRIHNLRRILIAALVVACIGIVLGPFLFRRLSEALVGGHMRAITRELEDWAREYSQISTLEDAKRSTEMLEYIRVYYVPDEGYRSDPDTEARLESQRHRTQEAITIAIEDFKRRRSAEKLPEPRPEPTQD